MCRLRIIDSHTEGEPTRVVPIGELEILGRTMSERRNHIRDRLDHYRRGLVLEPRGSEATVGAILTPPENPDSVAGVVFCNNVGYLGMCGHGSIGVVATLRYMGVIDPGRHFLDTPVGRISANLLDDGSVEIENVPSYRYLKDVELSLDSFGLVTGDVVYGGNWFFLHESQEIQMSLSNKTILDLMCREIKKALNDSGITGTDGAQIDHVELSRKVHDGRCDSINYVMCPGDQYDRSPCGTGTSAKIAGLIEDGFLSPGEWYVQQSITGTQFRGRAEIKDGLIIPTIVGKAWIVSEGQLIFSEDDPHRWGFP